MSAFDEILAKIKGDNPELADTLSTAYINDMESRDEKIKGLESTIAEKNDKISVYAQENYDLMRAQPPLSDDDDETPPPVSARKVSLDDVAQHWRNK